MLIFNLFCAKILYLWFLIKLHIDINMICNNLFVIINLESNDCERGKLIHFFFIQNLYVILFDILY